MKWSWNELRQAGANPIQFETTLDVQDNLKARQADIIAVSSAEVKGMFSVDELGVLGYMRVKVKVTLPSTRSLKPADVCLDFDLTEHYVSRHDQDLSRFEDTDVVIVLDDDILDLNSVVEDNILLQIPMQVLTADEQREDAILPSGNDWNVVYEDQLKDQQEKQVDPRLAKLKDLFSDSE
ncbi:YceD family protein [Ligilactobacillus sp. Marseille-Q7487]|jgi:uncharacterized protein|uniref:YceD family protein n=1 Tax=Ligilactobacillus sp. Marseille-Q7487 TaxID=3022128 RepID=UPI0015B62305|nr:YceD family protein [Ligilactobacillus sp. Marseille-Q7487]